MVELNSELVAAMREFQKKFGDIVPLRELPQNVTNTELLDVINESLKTEKNLLPERFGFGKLDADKDILI